MFVTPFVKVKGTLSSPSVGLNKKGTLLTGGAAFATDGLSLLLKGVFDRATAEGDKCEKALEMAGQHTSYEFWRNWRQTDVNQCLIGNGRLRLAETNTTVN